MSTEASAPLPAARITTAAGTLARAFHDDPMFTYLVPDAARRPARLGRFFQAGLRYGLHQGVVEATPATEGVAIWLPPGGATMTFGGLLRSGMVTALLGLGPGGVRRFLHLTGPTEEVHKRHAPGQHWYLLAFGVEPARQGHGLGGALLAAGVARADATGLPCYLETLTERAAAFYGRQGFRVVEDFTIADGPRTWAMRREPNAGAP